MGGSIQRRKNSSNMSLISYQPQTQPCVGFQIINARPSAAAPVTSVQNYRAPPII